MYVIIYRIYACVYVCLFGGMYGCMCVYMTLYACMSIMYACVLKVALGRHPAALC